MNKNILKDFKCPDCGASDLFHISATAFFTVTDDGAEYGSSDYDNSINWDDESPCVCGSCAHMATVGEFRPSPENGFQYFEDAQAVLDFICGELAQVLEEDAERLDDDFEPDTADGRRRKAADIRKIEPLVRNAERLRVHLEDAAEKLAYYFRQRGENETFIRGYNAIYTNVLEASNVEKA